MVMTKILHPYCERRFHLDPGDFAQRVVLCHCITPHPQLSCVVSFTDEKYFTRDGINNELNLCTWSLGNQHQTSRQFPKVFCYSMVRFAC